MGKKKIQAAAYNGARTVDYLLKKLHKWRHLSKSASSQKVKQQKETVDYRSILCTYLLDVLWSQPIKLIQGALEVQTYGHK